MRNPNVIERLQERAYPCLHCGNQPIANQHIDNSATEKSATEYKYNFTCQCGICTEWFSEGKLLSVWNQSVRYSKYRNSPPKLDSNSLGDITLELLKGVLNYRAITGLSMQQAEEKVKELIKKLTK